MMRIIENVLKRLDKNCGLDEMKAELKKECKKATFEITEKDWIYMMTEILYRLS